MKAPLVVVGAGGHAKVVIASARAAGYTQLRAVDRDSRLWGKRVLDVSITGDVDAVLTDAEALVVLAIGDNATRLRLATAAQCGFATLVHPSAVVDASVELGAGSVVFAGAVIQPDTRIGRHGIVNTAASIDHDCVLGTCVHIAPGVRLAGMVTVGDGVLVGIGACVIPGITIGASAIVGAGAAVVRDVATATTVIGVPARTSR
jgi:sugar O-acyltransferase (sialic acid O-acetyltransferase NeuD family)